MTKVFARVAATVLLVALLAGCGKKTEEDPAAAATEVSAPADAASAEPVSPAPAQGVAPAPGREVLPGASSVRNALERKDYQRAVGGLLALKGAAVASPQTEEYMQLYDEVKLALIEASATDRNAAAALTTLRVATAGR